MTRVQLVIEGVPTDEIVKVRADGRLEIGRISAQGGAVVETWRAVAFHQELEEERIIVEYAWDGNREVKPDEFSPLPVPVHVFRRSPQA